MQRNKRHLHGKTCEECEEEKTLSIQRERRIQECFVAERRLVSRGEIERQNGDKHEQRTDKGEKKEFEGCVCAPSVPPDPDEEVHRNQRRLPEQIEQEHVEGGKNADHPGLESQQEDEEWFDFVLDIPRCKDRQRHEERGE